MTEIFSIINKLGQLANAVIPNNLWALAIPFILAVGIFKMLRSL